MNFTSNISGSKPANKVDSTQASRSAARDADLRRRLLHRQHQMAKQQKPVEAPIIPQTTSSKKISPVEIQQKKKLFQKYRFFLYKLDYELEVKLARKIFLLGATREAFFSSKCTHIITNSKLLSSLKSVGTSTPTGDSEGPVDIIIQNAKKWKLELWGLEGALKIVNILLESSTATAKAHERANRDEKKPHFVEFTGHYLLIEDSTQVHSPVLIKEYTKELIKGENKPAMIPWPTLKRKRKAQEAQNADAPAKEEQTPRPPEKRSREPDTEKSPEEEKLKRNKHNEDVENLNQQMSGKLHLGDPEKEEAIKAEEQKENKSNVNNTEEEKLKQEKAKAAKRKRNADLQFCENCNERFNVLADHIKTTKHAAFTKNPESFFELDQLLKRVKRT